MWSVFQHAQIYSSTIFDASRPYPVSLPDSAIPIIPLLLNLQDLPHLKIRLQMWSSWK